MKPSPSCQPVVAAPGQGAIDCTFSTNHAGARSSRRRDDGVGKVVHWLTALLFAMATAYLSPAEAQTHPPSPGSDSPEAALKQRAAAISQEAFSELSSNLLAAITRSGLNAALPYCSEKAMPITKSVAEKNGVGLSRITHKPRNPANLATKAELAILQQFQAQVAAKQTPAPVLVTNANRTVSVYLPIVIPNAMCLMCHGRPGTEVSAELQATIRTLYPKDQATGFAQGDLRGAWRVDFPNPPLTPRSKSDTP